MNQTQNGRKKKFGEMIIESDFFSLSMIGFHQNSLEAIQRFMDCDKQWFQFYAIKQSVRCCSNQICFLFSRILCFFFWACNGHLDGMYCPNHGISISSNFTLMKKKRLIYVASIAIVPSTTITQKGHPRWIEKQSANWYSCKLFWHKSKQGKFPERTLLCFVMWKQTNVRQKKLSCSNCSFYQRYKCNQTSIINCFRVWSPANFFFRLSLDNNDENP